MYKDGVDLITVFPNSICIFAIKKNNIFLMKQIIFIVLTLFSFTLCYSQQSDNGDGTFTNPVLWTDLPDPDVTQVGDTFYFVSTSMHMIPGVTILKSTDLVNWTYAANVVPQFDNDSFFNLENGNRYACGQWATAIRYWGGEFHVLFTSNSNGTYIYSSPTMEGKWRKTTIYEGPYNPLVDRFNELKEQNRNDGFFHHILYDPGMLVDHDGRVYVVHGNSINYITELDPVSLQPRSKARVLYKAHRPGLEGNKLYHIGAYYYMICTYGGSHSGNVTCLRSRSLNGPWEEREVFCCGAREPNSHLLQACIIPIWKKDSEADGHSLPQLTWAMTFLDMGALGRIPHLIPVHWIDGWPVFGNWANGNLKMNKPIASNERMGLATTDSFSSSRLGLQWQFNHNPDNSKWSLTERPGWLRLHATKICNSMGKHASRQPNKNCKPTPSIRVNPKAPFLMARNTITQRLFGPKSDITVKVDISHLLEGDKAGIAILNIPYGTLTISKKNKGYVLLQTKGDDQEETVLASESIPAKGNQIMNVSQLWLRVAVDGMKDESTFFYSLDGKCFQMMGPTFKMEYSGRYFVGNRFALFCYNDHGGKGYLDVDDCTVNVYPLFNRNIRSGTTLQAEWTDALWRTEITSDADKASTAVRWTGDGGLIAFDNLQFSEDIRALSFSTDNISGQNVFIEVKDRNSQETLGTSDIPAPENYKDGV